MAITKEQVAEVAAAIQAEGFEPTYINVRGRLGSGSFSTIQKYLKEWRSSGSEIKPEAEELPEPFREVLQRFGLEAWRAVSVWAKDELKEAKKDFERRVAENQAETEKAAATVDALQVELNKVGEERDSLRKEVEQARSKLAAAQGALSETRKQVEREAERNSALERRIQELSERLIEESAKAKALELGVGKRSDQGRSE